MRHIAASFLSLALFVGAVPAAAQQLGALPPQTVVGGSVATDAATISGAVLSPDGAVLGNMKVQARDLLTGQIGGSVRSEGSGDFVLTGVKPGNYVIEVVDDAGQIVGTSSYVIARAGASVVAATVMATTGALTSITTAAATSLATTLGATAARSMTFAAAAAGVAGVVAPPEAPVASASR